MNVIRPLLLVMPRGWTESHPSFLLNDTDSSLPQSKRKYGKFTFPLAFMMMASCIRKLVSYTLIKKSWIAKERFYFWYRMVQMSSKKAERLKRVQESEPCMFPVAFMMMASCILKLVSYQPVNSTFGMTTKKARKTYFCGTRLTYGEAVLPSTMTILYSTSPAPPHHAPALCISSSKSSQSAAVRYV